MLITVTTQRGKKVEIVSQSELRDPLTVGERVRAYCHIHGSDHQRSLSINKATGWGHCFNATCNATVIVAEWNPTIAAHLLQNPESYEQLSVAPYVPYAVRERLPLAIQPVLLHVPKKTPKWQQDELKMLQSLEGRMQGALAQTPRGLAYIQERGIPIEVALQAGVCYLPPEILSRCASQKQRWTLRRWTGRILFPLSTPISQGYIGRTLWRWQPGMDENTHKELLDQPRRPRRWIKTNPAGWFGSELEQLAGCVILVEGAFDRLTLLTAGLGAGAVIALTGTTLQIEWFPPQVHTIILALDGDEGGHEASNRLAEQLAREGFEVHLYPPPHDGWGKDWNERWRKLGQDGVQPLLDVYSALHAV